MMEILHVVPAQRYLRGRVGKAAGAQHGDILCRLVRRARDLVEIPTVRLVERAYRAVRGDARGAARREVAYSIAARRCTAVSSGAVAARAAGAALSRSTTRPAGILAGDTGRTTGAGLAATGRGATASTGGTAAARGAAAPVAPPPPPDEPPSWSGRRRPSSHPGRRRHRRCPRSPRGRRRYRRCPSSLPSLFRRHLRLALRRIPSHRPSRGLPLRPQSLRLRRCCRIRAPWPRRAAPASPATAPASAKSSFDTDDEAAWAAVSHVCLRADPERTVVGIGQISPPSAL